MLYVVLPGAVVDLVSEPPVGGASPAVTGAGELLIRLRVEDALVEVAELSTHSATTVTLQRVVAEDCLQPTGSAFGTLLTNVEAEASSALVSTSPGLGAGGGGGGGGSAPSGQAVRVTHVTRTAAQHACAFLLGQDVDWDSDTAIVVPALDLQWNPTTIKALQVFLYQQKVDAGASPVAPPRHGAAAPGAGQPAAGPPSAPPSAPTAPAPAAPAPQRPPLSRLSVTATRFRMHLNKETEGYSLADLVARDLALQFLDVPVRGQVPLDFQLLGSLASLVVRDVSHHSAMPEVLALSSRAVEALGSSEERPVTFTVRTFHPVVGSEGLDSLISAAVPALRAVYVNQTWAELIGALSPWCHYRTRTSPVTPPARAHIHVPACPDPTQSHPPRPRQYHGHCML
jgi:hypothetical protein